MALKAAVFFMKHDPRYAPLKTPLLFDPAVRWVTAALRRAGAEKFLVLCPSKKGTCGTGLFPENTVFVDPKEDTMREAVAAFLSEAGGECVLISHPAIFMPKRSEYLPASACESLPSFRSEVFADFLRSGGSPDTFMPIAQGEPAGYLYPLPADLRALSRLEQALRAERVDDLLSSGVRVVSPENTFAGPEVTVGAGTTLLPGTILKGKTSVGENCTIGPNTVIDGCTVGNGASVNASQLTESVLEDGVIVGPFAYVRPNCRIAAHVKVGDFVEVKNSRVGTGTKIPHLTYVGDTDCGSGVNYGCGSITVNYDGNTKHRTTVEDGAFIGCNTSLVAPVTVGAGAYTAAGSTVTREVPPDALAVARNRQVNLNGWAAKHREKKDTKTENV